MSLKLYLTVIIILITSIIYAQEVPRSLYVLNGLGRTVSKMNLENNQITNNTAIVGDIPSRIYSHNNLLYVVNSTPAGISIISPLNDQIKKNISLPEGSNPWDMAFTGADKAYVTNLIANTVSVLDLESGELADPISVGTAPAGIIVVNNTAYVANSGGYPSYSQSSVSVIDIERDLVIKTLKLPANPQDLAAGPDGNIYVVCTGNYVNQFGKIVKINPFADVDYSPLVVDTIVIGGSPGDIVVTNGGITWLAEFGDGSNGFLYSYDIFSDSILNDSSDPVKVGNGAMQLFYDKKTDDLYVNNFSDDNIQLLDASNGLVKETYNFGDGAQHMTILEEITNSDPWADKVVSFTEGTGAGFGMNYFPQNILGPPDPDPLVNEYNPSSKSQEILSLGENGEIILGFTDNYIFDGDGPDFTVFENVFYFFGTTDPFIEAAYVSVSQDGETWYAFPADTATFEGFAGVTPTFNTEYPQNPKISGGDQFDLSDVSLDYARYIKLTDLGSEIKEGAFNGDFDLDAVVAINSKSGTPSLITNSKIQNPKLFNLAQNYPNPFNPITSIQFQIAKSSVTRLEVYNLNGRLVRTLLDKNLSAGDYRVTWDGKNADNKKVASGVYIYRLISGEVRMSKRMLLLR
jgi:YVTN family beta-propeller protein